MQTANTHAVFSVGRLCRVLHPSSLVAFRSSHAATAAACPRLRTSAGERLTAARSLAEPAARQADIGRANSLLQWQSGETADADFEPTAPTRARSMLIFARDVPWNPTVRAAMLQFWTHQGALLSEGEVQPEQQTEQRRLRSKILRWAASHPRQRDSEVLTDYMARAREAAAASSWADDPWRIALQERRCIAKNLDPANLIQKMQAAQRDLAEHNICLSPAQSLTMASSSTGIAAKVIRLQSALDALAISLNPARIARLAPRLMAREDVGVVLQRRVAAIQQLRPQLDVAHILKQHPSLLTFTRAVLTAKWASLQLASGLGNDDMRALVGYNPGLLNRWSDAIGWKFRQIHAYDMGRSTAGAAYTPVSSMARVLSAASWRVWQLCYLAEAANFRYSAETWVKMDKQKFAALNPGYRHGLS